MAAQSVSAGRSYAEEGVFLPTESSVRDSDAASTASQQGPRMPAGARSLLHHLVELIELEVQLITLRCAKVARDAMVRMCLIGVAVIAFLLGVVFLYIGIFRVLEKFLEVWQICIIYAVAHFLLGAGILLAGGTKKNTQPTSPGDSHVN